MANTNSAKGNPASHRMTYGNGKNRRIANKQKNEQLRAKNQHPKQIRQKVNDMRAKLNKALEHDHKKKWTKDEAALARAVFGVEIPARRMVDAA